jgi:hypothetical protein
MASKITNVHGQTFIGGLNRVFHCNYYNAYLQTAVLLSEGAGDCQPRRLLSDAVVPLVRRLRKGGYTDKDLQEEFSFCGFGKLRRAAGNREWLTPTSHYGQAAIMHGHGECSCYFNVGYIAGMCDLETRETMCKQARAPVDWYKTGEALHPVEDYLKRPAVLRPAPPRFGFPEAQPFETTVDEASIIEAVSGLPLFGKSGVEDTGLIDAFGVVLTNHFADYYNFISYESYYGMLKAGMPLPETQDVFVQGGHICAFNTFGGIMSSPEWDAVVRPMCRTDEDWIHGMIAIANALGWGVWRVEKIVPGRELIIRVYNSYEGVGYRRMYPRADDTQLSFLVMGGVQGLAHLFWKIDIKERPTLNQDFYAKVFNSPENKFSVKQTHAIAAGHDYDRVVAWRN